MFDFIAITTSLDKTLDLYKVLNYKIVILGREAYFGQINLNMEVTTKKAFHRQLNSKQQEEYLVTTLP